MTFIIQLQNTVLNWRMYTVGIDFLLIPDIYIQVT